MPQSCPQSVAGRELPVAYLSMGLTAERLAERFHITREEARQFLSPECHKKPCAIAAGNFEDQQSRPISFTTAQCFPNLKRHGSHFQNRRRPPRDTTFEALSTLWRQPSTSSTVTRWQLFSDFVYPLAAVVMSADRAKQLGIQPLVPLYVAFGHRCLQPEEMGTWAVLRHSQALSNLPCSDSKTRCVRTQRSLRGGIPNPSPSSGGRTASRPRQSNACAIALGDIPLGCIRSQTYRHSSTRLQTPKPANAIVTMCVRRRHGCCGHFENLSDLRKDLRTFESGVRAFCDRKGSRVPMSTNDAPPKPRNTRLRRLPDRRP